MARSTTPPSALIDFDSLPDSAHVDINVVARLTGRSTRSIWRDVTRGAIPSPVSTGPHSTRWNVGALRVHLRNLRNGD